MSTTPEPTDDQLAAWLAGDLDADSDRAVTAAVREDPAVAERAGALAEVLARLAQHAPTPPPPPAPVDAIMAAIAAAAERVPASQPLPVAAAGTAPAGGLHRTSIRPPDDPTFTRRLERSPRGGRGTSTRPGGAQGRRRRDRALSGVAVLALLALLSTVGIQSLRDGGPFGRQDPTGTTAEDQADSRGQGEDGATDDSADATGDTADEDAADGSAAGQASETEEDDVAGVDPSPDPTLDPDLPALPTDEAATEPSRPGGTGGDAAAGDDAATGGSGSGAPGPAPAPQPAPRPTADPPAEDDQAAAPPGEDPADGEAGDGGQGGGPEDAPAPPEGESDGARQMTSPTVADSMVDLPDAAAVQAYFANRPEAQQLIGLSGVDARERAARHARDVGASPPFAWGVHPSECLDAATAGPGTTVIAAVESATYAGQRALAHLVVTGTDSLTRAFAVITDCSTCEVLLRVEVDV